MTTIKLKNGSGAPLAGDLVQGEAALDLTNKRLYTEDSGGTVIEVGTNPGEDVTFADNRKAIFGAGSDLEIFHDGSSTNFIQSSTSNIEVKVNGGGNFKVGDEFGNHLFIVNDNGDVQLKHGSTPALKLATTSTGIDVTGSVTADGLTVDGTSANPVSFLRTTSASEKLELSVDDGNVVFDSYQDESGRYGGFVFQGTENGVGTRKRFEIAYTTGDILFYEDTGTTAKMVWKSADERLGIGTSSPTNDLHISSTTGSAKFTSSAGGANLFMESADGNITRIRWSSNTNFAIRNDTTSTDVFNIDQSGNVGIGVVPASSSSPTWQHIQFGGTGNLVARKSDTTVDAVFASNYYVNASEQDTYITTGAAARMFINDNVISFDQAASGTAGSAISFSEAMRIDSSGHLIVPNGITLGTAVGTYNAANTLADYEEGTWTPTGTGVTLGSPAGTYTKVGRLVTVNWLFVYPTTSSGSSAPIAGLPFTVATGYTNGGNQGYVSGSAAVSIAHITTDNSTNILYRTANGGVTLTHADLSGATIRGSMTYMTN